MFFDSSYGSGYLAVYHYSFGLYSSEDEPRQAFFLVFKAHSLVPTETPQERTQDEEGRFVSKLGSFQAKGNQTSVQNPSILQGPKFSIQPAYANEAANPGKVLGSD